MGKIPMTTLWVVGFMKGLCHIKWPHDIWYVWYSPAPQCKVNGPHWVRLTEAWASGWNFGRLRAPIRWQIGCTSHKGESLVLSPIFSHFWQWLTKLIAWKVIIRENISSNEIKEISRELFGEWWYQGDSPEFGWITWAVALRRAMRNVPAGRQQARWQDARIS